MDTHG